LMLEVDPVKLFSFEGMDWDEKMKEPTEDEVGTWKNEMKLACCN
jgi:hypothetical protein